MTDKTGGPTQIYRDALEAIAAYQSPEHLHENSEDEWGLRSDEAIEMAYENVIQTAKFALRQGALTERNNADE